MAAVGGSIQEVSIKGRTFPATADADAARKLGGFENDVKANGDGVTARVIKTRVPWSWAGLELTIDDDRGDQEFLQDVANGKFGEFVPMTIDFANGTTYQATGTITGEIQYSSQNTTATIAVAGPGTASPQ